MKKLLALRLAPRRVLLLLHLLLVPIARVEAQPPQSAAAHDELFPTIASLDGEVFDAYNRCDLEKFATFFTDDLSSTMIRPG